MKSRFFAGMLLFALLGVASLVLGWRGASPLTWLLLKLAHRLCWAVALLFGALSIKRRERARLAAVVTLAVMTATWVMWEYTLDSLSQIWANWPD